MPVATLKDIKDRKLISFVKRQPDSFQSFMNKIWFLCYYLISLMYIPSRSDKQLKLSAIDSVTVIVNNKPVKIGILCDTGNHAITVVTSSFFNDNFKSNTLSDEPLTAGGFGGIDDIYTCTEKLSVHNISISFGVTKQSFPYDVILSLWDIRRLIKAGIEFCP